MNIKDYIASGILEAYVLDQLSEKERMEVLQLTQAYPEIREELNKIESAFEELAFQTAITPGAHVKDKILSHLEQNEPYTPVKWSHKKVRSQTIGNAFRLALAASVSIALVASILAGVFWNKWKSTEDKLKGLLAQNQEIASEYNQVQQRLAQIESDLKVVNNPAFHRVRLQGTGQSPESEVQVYWNPSSQEVYLNVLKLQKLSEDNQYQLWAIIEGKPVDAGVFDLAISTLLKMKSVGNASAFAITIEPKGGSATPSLHTMQAIGNTEG
ncbi:anti-sigma factor [Rapidithrix thailandica]|uniref:Regulator of SigK n=1 Tax=Rapidithrix thailandica TaxID=413964 RepID=A0AAW9SDJ8_9BACT